MKRWVTIPAGPSSEVLDGSGGAIIYWSFRETTDTTPAYFRLWDGSTNAGNIILSCSISAAQSFRDHMGTQPLRYKTGLYLEVISGTFEGGLYLHTECAEEYAMPVVVIENPTINIAGS